MATVTDRAEAAPPHASMWSTQCRRAAWRHPEWWCLALSAGAWVALVAMSQGVAAPVAHQPWAHAQLGAAPPADMAVVAGGSSLVGSVGHWLLMTVAMMLPLNSGVVRTTAARSLWRRRHRAIAAFLCGYVLPWALAGVLASVVLERLAASAAPHASSGPLAVAAMVALAAAWQITPVKGRALLDCHRTMPLAPHGWRATRDGVRYGTWIGTRCVISCGPLMLVCVAAGHSVPANLAIAGLSLVERRMPPRAARIGVGLALASLALALTAHALAARHVIGARSF